MTSTLAEQIQTQPDMAVLEAEDKFPEELIVRAQAGDEVAQAEIWPLIEPIAESVARRFSRNQTTIEDIVCDGLERVYVQGLQHHKYTPGTNFRGWVHRVVFTTALNRYKKERRDLSTPMDINESWDIMSDDDTEAEAINPNKSNAIRLLMKEAGVNPLFIEPFVLRYIEGYHLDEIAVILGIKNGTVDSRLNRAKRDFKHTYPDKSLVPEL
jgi:RNA polymerase sigma-70 factor (ECF subfamily)